MESGLNRFKEAQKEAYPCALEELKKGKKKSHWMWYIFPQIKGLGHSSTIITSNVYFDKNKLIIDCTDELNNYIDRIKPKEETKDKSIPIIGGLDTNFMVNRFI